MSIRIDHTIGCQNAKRRLALACYLVSASLGRSFKRNTNNQRLMPEDSVYGDWPASGEIDIAESRGNNGDSYADVGGRDSLISALVSSSPPSNS